MAKFTDTLNGFILVKTVRVPAFTAVITRDKFAHFCRYSCISDTIIK